MSAEIIQFGNSRPARTASHGSNVQSRVLFPQETKIRETAVSCVVNGNTYEVTFDQRDEDDAHRVDVIVRRTLNGRPNVYKRSIGDWRVRREVIDAARAKLAADPNDATTKAIALRDEQEQYRRKAAEHLKKAEEYNRRVSALDQAIANLAHKFNG